MFRYNFHHFELLALPFIDNEKYLKRHISSSLHHKERHRMPHQQYNIIELELHQHSLHTVLADLLLDVFSAPANVGRLSCSLGIAGDTDQFPITTRKQYLGCSFVP
jgi:hypothetical protein